MEARAERRRTRAASRGRKAAAGLEQAHEAAAALTLATGRLLRLMSRPAQPGDAAAFHDARRVALDAAAVLGLDGTTHAPNWARDRGAGAAGD